MQPKNDQFAASTLKVLGLFLDEQQQRIHQMFVFRGPLVISSNPTKIPSVFWGTPGRCHLHDGCWWVGQVSHHLDWSFPWWGRGICHAMVVALWHAGWRWRCPALGFGKGWVGWSFWLLGGRFANFFETPLKKWLPKECLTSKIVFCYLHHLFLRAFI